MEAGLICKNKRKKENRFKGVFQFFTPKNDKRYFVSDVCRQGFPCCATMCCIFVQ